MCNHSVDTQKRLVVVGRPRRTTGPELLLGVTDALQDPRFNPSFNVLAVADTRAAGDTFVSSPSLVRRTLAGACATLGAESRMAVVVSRRMQDCMRTLVRRVECGGEKLRVFHAKRRALAWLECRRVDGAKPVGTRVAWRTG
jgi:hypothetical protein